MQFSHTPGSNGGARAGRLALIAGLHVAVALVFIHSMNHRQFSLPSLPDSIPVDVKQDPVEPPPPPEPPKPMPNLAPPPLVVPLPEIPVTPPPDPAPVRATTTPDPAPQPATPAHAVADAPPALPAAPSNANSGQVRTAVLADPKACALPDYPARAAREGISGTTLLALLVGADGRVTSSRIEHSSGSRDLDRAAVNALSLCKFKPATNNGVAEAGWAQLAYVWTLD